ncbi:hypothetical protein BGX34_011800 [Mortierella sp. NVP85]|nr:hypothetical protein BGX34_011800 [Mortierella sp. NVP85]
MDKPVPAKSPKYVACEEKDLVRENIIDAGQNAIVYQGHGIAQGGQVSDQLIAIKVPKPDSMLDITNEIKALEVFHAKPEESGMIVGYYGHKSEQNQVKQVYLELLKGKTLSWAVDNKYFTTRDEDHKVRKSILVGVIEGIQFLIKHNASNVDFNVQNIWLQSAILAPIKLGFSGEIPDATPLDTEIKVRLFDFGKTSFQGGQNPGTLLTILRDMYKNYELDDIKDSKTQFAKFVKKCEAEEIDLEELRKLLLQPEKKKEKKGKGDDGDDEGDDEEEDDEDSDDF